MSELSVYTGPTSNSDNQLRLQQAQRSPAYDSVDKIRVSTPQSLIDTDFEYGQQSTKWEQLSLQSNRSSCWYNTNTPILITTVTSASTGGITYSGPVVTVFTTQNPGVGVPIFVENTLDPNANGWFLTTQSTSSQIQYVANAAPTFVGNLYAPTATYAYIGNFYTNCGFAVTPNSTSAITVSSNVITVNTIYPHGLSANSLVYITGTTGGTGVNGAFIVSTVPTTTSFTISGITASGTVTTSNTNLVNGYSVTNVYTRPHGAIDTHAFDGSVNFTVGSATPNAVLMRQTRRYFRYQSGKGIQFSTGTILKPQIQQPVLTSGVFLSTVAVTGTAGQFSCTSQGGLAVGQLVYVYGTLTGSATGVTPGIYFIIGTPTATTFTLSATSGGSAITTTAGSTTGLTFVVGGILGYAVIVTTKFAHNLTSTTKVQVSNFDQTSYNGIFNILGVPTGLTFIYQTVNYSVPAVSPATATVPRIGNVSPYSWYGSSNALGFFDQQNGLFFRYDGQTLYAVFRNSILQISGLASVTQGSALVTGTNTAFSTQLIVGDYIVIRGQSYRVATITSDTQMYINPEYRGNNTQTLGGTAQTGSVTISRTIDTAVPQSLWYDPLDGTGPSGYVLDLTKVQMFYIDYSWYGAGVARFGIRTTGGTIQMLYNFQNNNVQYGAYMRSGNLPSHYEQNGIPPITTITSSVTTGSTSINVLSTAGFNPAGGTARIIGNGSGAVIEYVTYTGLTDTSLTGLTRGVTGGGVASAFTYSAQAPIAVEYAAPDAASPLSHWGSSVVMDGGFNNDVSLLFNYGMQTPITTNSTTGVYPIMAIRVAPTVDNGQVGSLGVKEIINRLQLQLRELALFTSTAYLVQFIVNGTITGTTLTTANLTCTGSTGQFSLTGATNIVISNGSVIQVTGTLSGNVTGIATGNSYIVTNFVAGSTATFTLVNLNGSALSTGGTTTTGLVFTYNPFTTFQSPTQNSTNTSSICQVATNTSTAAIISGGESIAAFYTNGAGQTVLDLTSIAAFGNAILGGGLNNSVPLGVGGFFPDGPDILYVVCQQLNATGGNAQARITWQESQA